MPPETHKQKILLIEDDIFIIELLAKELTRGGFEVLIAKTGAEGKEKFRQGKPDLIVLDILLPDQNGIETLREIRREPEGPKTKVLVLSNIAEGKYVEDAKRLGAEEYMIKANFSLQEITEKIRALLRG